MKVNHAEYWFDTIELPRNMTRQQRQSFERTRQTRFPNYTFVIARDAWEVVAKMLHVDRYNVGEDK